MVHLGPLPLGAIPRVAVALDDREVSADARAVSSLADVFELRIDQFTRHEPSYVADVAAAARSHGLPLLGTVRAANEGGVASLSDDQRFALFAAILPQVDALDIELHAAIRDRVIQLCRDQGKPVIASYHDFTQTPADHELVRLIDAGTAAGADIVKLATTATRRDDVDRLLGLLRSHRSKQLIIIALGPHGAASRVFFPLFGSLLTWGFLNRPSGTGQLPLRELVDALCRYDPAFAERHRR